MENIKIDYNTANIVFPIIAEGKEVYIHLPPAFPNEIKANALILGRFSEYITKRDASVVIKDWDIYLDKCINEEVSEELSTTDEKVFEIKTKEYKEKILALLERGLTGGYYYDENFEVQAVKDFSEDIKEKIRANMLFFIVSLRYIRERIAEEKWLEILKKGKITFTLLTATEYKNIITTQLSAKEDLKK